MKSGEVVLPQRHPAEGGCVLALSIRSMETEGSPDAAWRAGPLLAPPEPRLNHQCNSLQNTSIKLGVILLDKHVTAPVLHQLTKRSCKIKQDEKPQISKFMAASFLF